MTSPAARGGFLLTLISKVCFDFLTVGMVVETLLMLLVQMSSWSEKGNWLLVNWSLWVNISLADRPQEQILELSWAVVIANIVVDTGLPLGSCLSSCSSNSCTALLPTGFLFEFLACISSRVIL